LQCLIDFSPNSVPRKGIVMLQSRKSLLFLATLLLAVPVFGAAPTFRPDVTVKANSLSGWHTLGNATWKTQNGEIVGTVQSGNSGWLVLDHSLQNVELFSAYRCTGGCQTGVLLRAEKTPTGMKGIFVSLDPGDLNTYRVELDQQGKIVQKEKLRRAGGTMRIAPPADPNAPPPPPRAFAQKPPADMPITRPDYSLKANEWNTFEIFLDVNIARLFINNGNEVTGGVAEPEYGNYGPFALYLGGAGQVQFKDVAYGDAGMREFPKEETSSNFTKQQLTPFYYCFSAEAADFNHDGVMDIVSGPKVYYGPDFTKSREIYAELTTNPSDNYTKNCWEQNTADFTGDGWPDVMNPSFSGGPGKGIWLYVNPKGEARRWDRYQVVDDYQSELGYVAEIEGKGKPAAVYAADGIVRYAEPDPANPTGKWIVHDVSGKGYGTAHGIGAGDINGDGHLDILNAFGWWENPGHPTDQTWKYHPVAFSRYYRGGVGGSVMAAYDVNGDGLNDVVTSMSAHNFGLAWFEQKRDSSGNISFVRHMIMDDYSTVGQNAGGVTFSELHGSTFADVDGDGVPDFIVGKRYWAHCDDFFDPDPYGDPVLYVYKTVRDPKAPGGARFVPELINNHSGAGSDVTAADLNKDGAIDIITSTKLGLYIFWGKPGARMTSSSTASARR
jgi:hypothetical protein